MKNFILLLLIVSAFELQAIPRFALMRGNQCRDCHSNPTGGLIRNQDGWTYGKNNLRMFKGKQSNISPFLNENISIGFDFRFQYLYSQELKKTDFHKMTGGIYSNFEMSENLNFIAAYDIYRGYFEGYGVIKVLPSDGYIKIGSFSPNFGLKIDDHTAYTRNGDAGVLSSTSIQGMIFAPGYSQTGFEFGFFPNDFSFVSFSMGQDKFPFRTDPSYIGRFEFTPSVNKLNLMLGGSYGVFRNNQNKFNLTSFFGGFGLRNFSFLSEFVLAKDYAAIDVTSQALMLETSFKIKKWFRFSCSLR